MTNKILLRKWQSKLNLNDWTIVLMDNCSPYEMQDTNNVGECEWQEVNKVAVIRIINPAVYGNRILPFEFEKILIHELLHIKFWALENSGDDLQERIVHQLIEEFARIFTKDSGGSEQ